MMATQDADFVRLGFARMSRTVTTIYHDGQFWVALVERFGVGGNYSCARHVFGPEPNNAELLIWASSGFSDLVFAAGSTLVADARAPNPKRMHRTISREMRAKPTDTLAQQTIKEALSERQVNRRHQSAKHRAEETTMRFELKSAKRKKARRGH